MPAPLARGIIITVSVLVAASLAAYENPQVRAWIDRTRRKIAMGLHSLGDEIHPKPRPRRTSTDVSMREEKGEMAEARRQRAIAEIMERGRIIEERRKRRKVVSPDQAPIPSFDTMVDENGVLLKPLEDHQPTPMASTSGIDALAQSGTLRQRTGGSKSEATPSALCESVDASLPLRHLPQTPVNHAEQNNPFESRYEREMRDAWHIPLSERHIEIPSSHASESLIELTPTTEDAPDPDFSIPSAEYLHHPLERTEYFSAAASNSTHTLSNHELHTSLPVQSTYPNLPGAVPDQSSPNSHTPASTTPSINASVGDIHASEAEGSADDFLSEIGDGIRTPASSWTEVDSTASGDFNL
ncbi:uncharacterized protein Z518_06198 [Rhinocladiella mackenziei CBS 650.93]|uniref:Uncharacterized protein n=1 Tax=Rhinocladiella mackenziei CBS 650.93 TaxID=1442369 RepID=A0A0D2IQ55_9EURO|nr:uncharacterized protein Z518_06198 [Rhinocladiella mackenziei CBS 650.93]KIX05326.1 hypothetical protein Z518_06198 [Rhinocladiella mackenziei CBS 650.93]